jgi:hypothetical protein
MFLAYIFAVLLSTRLPLSFADNAIKVS